MVTYNNVIEAFNNFCSKHIQINTFYSGQTWNFQSETNIYPSIIMLPQVSSISKGSINLNFNIFATDLINIDRTNLDECYSDTLSIIVDLVAYFTYNEDLDFWIDETSVTIEPFEEEFDDVLAGWMASIKVEIKFDGSDCNLPMKN